MQFSRLAFTAIAVGVCVAMTSAQEVIVIDGRKNPEKIPQWLAWEQAFDTLATAKRKGMLAADESLQMSTPDKELVYAEALRQPDRFRDHIRQVETLRPLIGKVKDEAIMEKNRAMILEHRQATLDASKRLLDRLSPEGRTAMVAWVESIKAGITSTVPAHDLEFYRRPY